MTTFIIRRLLISIPVFIGITLLGEEPGASGYTGLVLFLAGIALSQLRRREVHHACRSHRGERLPAARYRRFPRSGLRRQAMGEKEGCDTGQAGKVFPFVTQVSTDWSESTVVLHFRAAKESQPCPSVA